MTTTTDPRKCGTCEFIGADAAETFAHRLAYHSPATSPLPCNDVEVGARLWYPVWRDRRPAGARGNVNPEALTVKAVVEYEHNRVLYFEPEGYAVVARTATLAAIDR